ncbi:MAG: hypothetical protein Q8P54_02765 [bacterium]|nr:hypothetical protein [bacterium]
MILLPIMVDSMKDNKYNFYAEKFIKYGDTDLCAALWLCQYQQNKNLDFMFQVAFLTAQAVEKYLKGYLINTHKEYQLLSGKQFYNPNLQEVLNNLKSLGHNLDKILEKCIKIDKGFEDLQDNVDKLNQFSFLKYPDEVDKLIYSEEGLTISSGRLYYNAKRVRKYVEKKLNITLKDIKI